TTETPGPADPALALALTPFLSSPQLASNAMAAANAAIFSSLAGRFQRYTHNKLMRPLSTIKRSFQRNDAPRRGLDPLFSPIFWKRRSRMAKSPKVTETCNNHKKRSCCGAQES